MRLMAAIVVLLGLVQSAQAGNCGNYCEETCVNGRLIQYRKWPYTDPELKDVGECGHGKIQGKGRATLSGLCRVDNVAKRDEARKNAQRDADRQCGGPARRTSPFIVQYFQWRTPYADNPCIGTIFTAQAGYDCL
jgi:hypothetical protein